MVPKVCHQNHFRPSLSRAAGSRYWSLLDLFPKYYAIVQQPSFFLGSPPELYQVLTASYKMHKKRQKDILCDVLMLAISFTVFH